MHKNQTQLFISNLQIMIKSLLILFLAIATVSFATAQTWKSDKAHSKLRFTVTHLGISEVDGVFKDFDATIMATQEDFSDASVEMTIETASVNTGNDGRDGHLQKADMFDAENHPQITFKSTEVKKIDDKNFEVIGDLTIKGVSKSIMLNLVLNGLADDRRSGGKIAGFTATTTINRTDFGVGNMPALAVGHDVQIKASGEFKKQ